MPAMMREVMTTEQTTARSRLLVTRKVDGMYRSFGFLAELEDGTFTFEYLADAVRAPWFCCLPGLSDVARRYHATALFPIFANRVPDERRPDRTATLEALALPSDTSPFAFLERSGGRRVGDEIEVLPVPLTSPGGVISIQFFVHGVRYTEPAAQAAIVELVPGEELAISPEPDNPADPQAIRVKDERHLRLGYVPAPLTSVIETVWKHSDARLRVVQANDAEVGYHYRLLVELSGMWPSGIDAPFAGDRWNTYPALVSGT